MFFAKSNKCVKIYWESTKKDGIMQENMKMFT